MMLSNHYPTIIRTNKQLQAHKLRSKLMNPINNKFFGICIHLGYCFGLLPDILEKRSKTFTILYQIYTVFSYSLAIFLHLTQLYKLYQIIADDNFIFDEAIRNYIITSIHFTTMLKSFFVKGKLSQKIFKHVMKYEEKVYKSKNTSIILVYNQTVSVVRKITALYFVAIIFVVITYIPAPLYRDPYVIQKGNETLEIKQTPLSSWTPFNNQDNYWPAFAWTSFAGTYLTVFFVTTDLTCFSFIMFGICQIMVLKHFILNFHQFSKTIQEEYGLDKIQSTRILQRECIIMHQEIINYADELNRGFKNIMLLDFVPSSLQLAGIIYQIMTNLNIMQCILMAQITGMLIARMFMYCKSTHDLSEQSQSLSSAWYDIDWSELPSDVQKNIILCINRSQKPLKISVGDFQDITLATFLTILKGTYTYIMVLTTV